MNIGFDAKRAFHNTTGLGNYSRNLLMALSEFYPDHEYYLFNPADSVIFRPVAKNMHEVQPVSLFHKLIRSAWRSSWVKKDLKKLNIHLYHGLSHEIPIGIHTTGIKSVVTIHDLIHERFPEQYSFTDANIYRKKFRYACRHADKIIAISEQTRKDIMEFYEIPAEKIRVCYQSCHPDFAEPVSDDEKSRVRSRYGLPDEYFLCVGSIIERKNLLNICRALHLNRRELNIPLVVIGDGGSYKAKVKEYISAQGLSDLVIFLSEKELSGLPIKYGRKMDELHELESEIFDKEDLSEEKALERVQSLVTLGQYERTEADFPAIYQSAIAMIYPSYFEGFGIPVLESLWSRLPVITSNVSCLPEAGGEGSYYVNPGSAEEIAEGMKKIFSDKLFATQMIEKGWQHAQNFTPEKSAASVMEVYKSV
ncbi:MAG TPA: glycosyltransferase family 1 protein [Chitinophagaceae bacterium]|nr:glycosyltransferase family 1 protein [Chitinophagaceae bacterium]